MSVLRMTVMPLVALVAPRTDTIILEF